MKGLFNQQRGFGVEIEFLVPKRLFSASNGSLNTKLASIVATHPILRDQNIDCQAEAYNHATRTYWKIVKDVSVEGNSTHIGRHEIVSPILYGEKGKQQLKAVLEVLRAQDCMVNKSCGIHVHHDVTELMLAGRRIAKKFLKNLCLLVTKFEHVIYRLIPYSRQITGFTYPTRFQIGRLMYSSAFSKKLLKKNIVKNVEKDVNYKYSRGNVQRPTLEGRLGYKSQIQRGRYSGLNLQNIWTRGSVEFRYMQGSLNFSKIWSWVVLTQAVVNTAEKANSIALTNIPTDGLFYFRKAIGFIGLSNRCADTKFANKWTKIKWNKFSTNFRVTDSCRSISQGLN